MASMFWLYILLIYGLKGHVSHTIKALYCQDPDSGKLYPVNSTWPSATFCGNYTCKIRKRNTTNTVLVPVRKINVTDISTNILNSQEDMDTSPSKMVNVERRIDSGITKLFPVNAESLVKSNEAKKYKQDEEKEDKDNDRYLSDIEIKTITEMLHSVKKSDLEAIVDIYNLAQDIYKEIDKAATDNLNNETITPETTRNVTEVKQGKEVKNKQRVSYWYEPLHFHNAKMKPPIDSHNEASSIVTTEMPTSKEMNYESYFKEVLMDKEFRRLPYYYPMSNFQRISSYTHEPKNNLKPPVRNDKKPCKRPISTNNYVLPPWINKAKLKPYPSEPLQGFYDRSLLLPLPFSYVNNYNYSLYPAHYYYNSYPWGQLNSYYRQSYYQQPYLGTAYLAPMPVDTVYAQPELNEEQNLKGNSIIKQDILDVISNFKDIEKKKTPEWQTDPLSEQVIEEIKGNAEKPKLLKTFPLRKKVKLDRVGKVIRLDETVRSKRNSNKVEVDNGDEEEAFLEKTTCESSTEPGYFRMGNMSRPYPACCPEKIDHLPN